MSASNGSGRDALALGVAAAAAAAVVRRPSLPRPPAQGRNIIYVMPQPCYITAAATGAWLRTPTARASCGRSVRRGAPFARGPAPQRAIPRPRRGGAHTHTAREPGWPRLKPCTPPPPRAGGDVGVELAPECADPSCRGRGGSPGRRRCALAAAVRRAARQWCARLAAAVRGLALRGAAQPVRPPLVSWIRSIVSIAVVSG